MKVGYCLPHKNPAPIQPKLSSLEALTAAGCEKTFVSPHNHPPNLENLSEILEFLRPHDCLVVPDLTHLATNLKNLLKLIRHLHKKKITCQWLHPTPLSTENPSTLHMVEALWKFEEDQILEKTQKGLREARARGKLGGRPPRITPETVAAAKTLLQNNTPIQTICKTLQIGKSSLYRHLPALRPIPSEAP